MDWGIELAERGWAPDLLIRVGIRRLLSQRIAVERALDCEAAQERMRELIRTLNAAPVAADTALANAQHYEVPSAYFQLVLGPRLKYSSCEWSEGIGSLAAAEEKMLARTCERARLEDGQRVLELGCGWGSLSLWMAEKYPRSEIHAVSNSRTQREFIEARARERGLTNLRVFTRDMNEFQPDGTFDRIVSVEMFEHMRNYRSLFGRVSSWLRPGGYLFLHIFCTRFLGYLFETDGKDDWMARHFFTGGVMPSDFLFTYFAGDLRFEDHWHVNGRHYSKTLEAWLVRHDSKRAEILDVFRQTLPPDQAARMFHRWRIFYLACSELFAWDKGNHWFVSHYLFRKPE